jgi:hypothetical protein
MVGGYLAWTYFSLHRPWFLTQAPESWPHTADARHLLDVEDEETMVVVLLALETNRLASRHFGVVQSLSAIDTERDIVPDRVVQANLLGRSLVDVVDESIVQVISLELERIKPVAASEHLVLLVLSPKSSGRESREDSANAQKE